MYLELENGQRFYGKSFGYPTSISGELVFQTGMVGYPESLTDPSYHRQILTLTYPIIGSYGVPSFDKDEQGLPINFESDKIWVGGLVVSEYNDQHSHWESRQNLGKWLYDNKIPAISGIDTRQLTLIIREHGTMKGRLIYENLTKETDEIPAFIELENNNLIEEVSNPTIRKYQSSGELSGNLLVYDFGIKTSQIKALLKRGFNLTVVPWNYFPDGDEVYQYDGIFLSNGPGNPEDCKSAIEFLQRLINWKYNKPIFGICMGHQVLSLASGAKAYKMKYGNRGHNIPVKYLDSSRCLITSQNHGYAIDENSLNDNWKPLFTNVNDYSNEGIYHTELPYFSMQFHPEAKGGPSDANFIFDILQNVIGFSKTGNINSNMILELINEKLITPVSEIKKYTKVLILGSGGLSIGQAGEFDYSGSQAIKAYKEAGINTVLINPNIATVQTSLGLADKIYSLPITVSFVEQVIEIERPDCIALSFGGQTALNTGIQLQKTGILEKYNVDVLGTPISAIEVTEDRQRFKEKIDEINEKTAISKTVYSISESIEYANAIGYPVLVRSAFALGGLGSGFANNEEELIGFISPILTRDDDKPQVIIDKSLKGWKEVEYEVVRDRYDNCITVCNMENLDPLGVHTGESIVVAPSQTLTDSDYNRMRDIAIKTVRHIGIVGECNIQYAMDPNSDDYFIIEINARLSRSSALASKATGYPLAYIAAKLTLGKSLVELRNNVTKETTACFEPSLDYCVVKIPRWDLRKFPMVSPKIGSSMKSVGEVMAISRTFEEAFQKGLRMMDENCSGFDPEHLDKLDEIKNEDDLNNPSYLRVFLIANLLHNQKYNIEEMYQKTKIDYWFLYKFQNIINVYHKLESLKINDMTPNDMKLAKQLGFSDLQIAKATNTTESYIRNLRIDMNVKPFIKLIDTVAGEFPCYTNYCYLTYNASNNEIQPLYDSGVMVMGSGVYRIGSSVEFDWCAVNCIKQIRKLGRKAIMINYNPETVSTDYDEADRLYFDELSYETIMDIYNFENPSGIVLSVGGQLPNNIAMDLYRQNVKILGTSPESIDRAENRFKFSRLLDNIGVDQPKWKELIKLDDTKTFCHSVGYPCLVRPSYVLSGALMKVVNNDIELDEILTKTTKVSKDYPVVISKFINDAKEIEVDAVARDGWVEAMAISEHIENAGIHSGDASLVLPYQDLTHKTILKIQKSVYKISKVLKINGPFNIQFIAKDDDILVIECNLRVSRTFPFISKTLDVNFIEIATNIMLGEPFELDTDTQYRIKNQKTINGKVGVKVSQFSFNRLTDTDLKLGVEMVSTGEVACFGKNHYQAYLKALAASGFNVPNIYEKRHTILISIGSYKFKKELIDSIKILSNYFEIYATYGTADYYNENLEGINIKHVKDDKMLLDMITKKQFSLVINVSDNNKTEKGKTHGYYLRTHAVKYGMSVITNVKCTKVFARALMYHYDEYLNVDPEFDSITSYKTVKLPLLMDIHTHVRDLDESKSGTWKSETLAALQGGVGSILAMPNTRPSIDNYDVLMKYKQLAENSKCDYFLTILGTPQLAQRDDIKTEMIRMSQHAIAMKLFLTGSHTKSDQIVTHVDDWKSLLHHWPSDRVVLLHIDDINILMAFLFVARDYSHQYHLCHLKSKEELDIIDSARKIGINITCEICPHHLFMNNQNERWAKSVCPNLISEENRLYLLHNLDKIDCFASDHAPHNDPKNVGISSLEWTLKLYATAIKRQEITLGTLITKMVVAPRKIMGLQCDMGTIKQLMQHNFIEIDMDYSGYIPAYNNYSEGNNCPYFDTPINGLIRRLVINNKPVMIDEEFVDTNIQGSNLLYQSKYYGSKQLEFVSDTNLFDTDLLLENTESDDPHIEYQDKDIISVNQFNRNHIRKLCLRAQEIKDSIANNGKIDILNGKTVSLVFYEPSTRTRLSFESAVKKMGGEVITLTPQHSSIQKGESILDSIRTIETYSDLIVLRSPEGYYIKEAAKVCSKPIINAGNGCGEHPTQALLDIYTIRQERGSIYNLTITFAGDLKNGRTVHSLVRLLSQYESLRFYYVCDKRMKLPEEIIKYVESKPNVEQYYVDSLEEILPKTDVLYMTRFQKERYNQDDDQSNYYYPRITPSSLANAKRNLIVMHPLPRNDEIDVSVDVDPRACYFRQMEYGLYMRMALIEMMLT